MPRPSTSSGCCGVGTEPWPLIPDPLFPSGPAQIETRQADRTRDLSARPSGVWLLIENFLAACGSFLGNKRRRDSSCCAGIADRISSPAQLRRYPVHGWCRIDSSGFRVSPASAKRYLCPCVISRTRRRTATRTSEGAGPESLDPDPCPLFLRVLGPFDEVFLNAG